MILNLLISAAVVTILFTITILTAKKDSYTHATRKQIREILFFRLKVFLIKNAHLQDDELMECLDTIIKEYTNSDHNLKFKIDSNSNKDFRSIKVSIFNDKYNPFYQINEVATFNLVESNNSFCVIDSNGFGHSLKDA